MNLVLLNDTRQIAKEKHKLKYIVHPVVDLTFSSSLAECCTNNNNAKFFVQTLENSIIAYLLVRQET